MQIRNCDSRVLVILLAACASAVLAGPVSPAHQLPGMMVVDASEFYDQIPAGDNIGGGVRQWRAPPGMFNNSVIDLVSKEDAVAQVDCPGSRRLSPVRAQPGDRGQRVQSFRGRQDRRRRVRQRAARLEGQRHIPTEEGHGGDSPHRHQPAAHAQRDGALEEPQLRGEGPAAAGASRRGGVAEGLHHSARPTS